METITIQETKYITKYKAIDGTIFNSDSECKKYEESAKCALLYKYNKFAFNRSIHISYISHLLCLSNL